MGKTRKNTNEIIKINVINTLIMVINTLFILGLPMSGLSAPRKIGMSGFPRMLRTAATFFKTSVR
jgi:hypothetical protein